MRAKRGAASGTHGGRAKAWLGAAGPSEVLGCGVSEPFGEAGDGAPAATPCHMPHHGARLPPLGTFLPLYRNEAQCCLQHKLLSKGDPGNGP